MKKVLLFDFFGVISSEISVVWFERHFDERTAKEIKALVVAKGDLGIISEDEVYEKISLKTGVLPEVIREEWTELVKINEPLVEFIKEIRKSYPVYLLSNAIGPFLHRILDRFNLYSLFDGLYISSEAQIAKPSETFFRGALERFNIRAEDALFTDDNEVNVKAAEAVGITAIKFTDNESFFRGIKEYFK